MNSISFRFLVGESCRAISVWLVRVGKRGLALCFQISSIVAGDQIDDQFTQKLSVVLVDDFLFHSTSLLRDSDETIAILAANAVSWL